VANPPPVVPDSPPLLHVIAGTVVDLYWPPISDPDIDGSTAVAGEHWWVYWVDPPAAGEVLLDDRANRHVRWKAPATECLVTLRVGGADQCPEPKWHDDFSQVYWTQQIRVHELEVSKVREYSDANENASYPGAGTGGWPTAANPHPHACQHWYHSDVRMAFLRYDRDLTNCSRKIVFAGGCQACIELELRGKGGWVGAVYPADVRLHAGWAGEGVHLRSGVAGVSQLPFGVSVGPCKLNAVSAEWDAWPLDRQITYEPNMTWNWDCTTYSGPTDPQTGLGQYVTPSDVRDAELDWVATAYATPMPQDQVTPVRVAEVYEALSGTGAAQTSPADVADAATDWAASHLGFNLARYWYGSPRDVWCAKCGWGEGDCITMARQAAEALRLVGLDGQPVCMYPQPVRGAPESWLAPHECWATPTPHPGYVVGYTAADGDNNYLAGFRVDGLPFFWCPAWNTPPRRREHPADFFAGRGLTLFCQWYDEDEDVIYSHPSAPPDHVLVGDWSN
jgi:hypothetical protein